MSQRKRVAATSSPSSRQRMMWPNRLFARGFAASGPGSLSRPRALLLVSVMYTSRVTGWTAPHSGRSIGVAPTRSADWRVFTSTSAWFANPLAAVSAALPVHEREPVAGAVGVEPRGVEDAVVEEIAVRRAVRRIPRRAR